MSTPTKGFNENVLIGADDLIDFDETEKEREEDEDHDEDDDENALPRYDMGNIPIDGTDLTEDIIEGESEHQQQYQYQQ